MHALTVHPVGSMGAEDVVVDAGGAVYTGTEDGRIWRLNADGTRLALLGTTGGRPLGLELYGDDLLVCDAHRGLLLISTATGATTSLVSAVDGTPMRFCNNAAVGAGGDVWFSDSSRHYGIERWKDDFVQNTRTGRLLHRTPAGEVTVVLEGLAFANGVALAPDESYVVVAETGARTLARHWLSGPRAGQRDLLAADLPGYPDNIALGSDGLVWVSIASPTDPVVEWLQGAPMPLRRAATRIPAALQPQPQQTVRVQAYDTRGSVVHDIDLPADGYHMVTGVREHEGRVWLGSLHEPAVAVFDHS